MNKEYKKYRDEVLKSIDNKDIKNRIEYLLNWYSRKATRCKYKYYIFAAVGIIGPALVTLISNCTYLKNTCAVPVISTFSSICAGILVLTRWQESWIRYRRTVELIKSEIGKYLIDITEITGGKKLQRDKEFVNKIEDIVINENSEWTSIRSKDLGNKGNTNNSQNRLRKKF